MMMSKVPVISAFDENDDSFDSDDNDITNDLASDANSIQNIFETAVKTNFFESESLLDCQTFNDDSYSDEFGKAYSISQEYVKDQSVTSFMSSMLEELPRNYICDQCGKGFCKPAHLTRHKMVHNAVRQFKCPYCNKEFYRKDKYKDHCKVHIRKTCKVCGLLFDKKSDLHRHMMESGHYLAHIGDSSPRQNELLCITGSSESVNVADIERVLDNSDNSSENIANLSNTSPKCIKLAMMDVSVNNGIYDSDHVMKDDCIYQQTLSPEIRVDCNVKLLSKEPEINHRLLHNNNSRNRVSILHGNAKRKFQRHFGTAGNIPILPKPSVDVTNVVVDEEPDKRKHMLDSYEKGYSVSITSDLSCQLRKPVLYDRSELLLIDSESKTINCADANSCEKDYTSFSPISMAVIKSYDTIIEPLSPDDVLRKIAPSNGEINVVTSYNDTELNSCRDATDYELTDGECSSLTGIQHSIQSIIPASRRKRKLHPQKLLASGNCLAKVLMKNSNCSMEGGVAIFQCVGACQRCCKLSKNSLAELCVLRSKVQHLETELKRSHDVIDCLHKKFSMFTNVDISQ